MSKKLKMYCAAVEMARIESKGSGNTNYFDHVAKDLHEEGFDEEFELIDKEAISRCVDTYSEDIWQMARIYIEKEPAPLGTVGSKE